jgi:hypothetical protein
MQGCTQLLQSLSRHFTDLSLSLKPIEHFKHVAVRVIPRSLPCRKYDLGVFSLCSDWQIGVLTARKLAAWVDKPEFGRRNEHTPDLSPPLSFFWGRSMVAFTVYEELAWERLESCNHLSGIHWRSWLTISYTLSFADRMQYCFFHQIHWLALIRVVQLAIWGFCHPTITILKY